MADQTKANNDSDQNQLNPGADNVNVPQEKQTDVKRQLETQKQASKKTKSQIAENPADETTFAKQFHQTDKNKTDRQGAIDEQRKQQNEDLLSERKENKEDKENNPTQESPWKTSPTQQRTESNPEQQQQQQQLQQLQQLQQQRQLQQMQQQESMQMQASAEAGTQSEQTENKKNKINKQKEKIKKKIIIQAIVSVNSCCCAPACFGCGPWVILIIASILIIKQIADAFGIEIK